MTSTAVTSVISGITPMARPGASGIEALSRPPAEMRRLSAEKAASRPFWVKIERPKVISNGGKMSFPTTRLRRKY